MQPTNPSSIAVFGGWDTVFGRFPTYNEPLDNRTPVTRERDPGTTG